MTHARSPQARIEDIRQYAREPLTAFNRLNHVFKVEVYAADVRFLLEHIDAAQKAMRQAADALETPVKIGGIPLRTLKHAEALDALSPFLRNSD